MPAEYRETECLVIKKHKYTESSAIIETFTHDMGKVSFLARGIYRRKSAFDSPMEPLSVNRVEYFSRPNREMHTLTKAALIFYPENTLKRQDRYDTSMKVMLLLRRSRDVFHTSTEIFQAACAFIDEVDSSEKPQFAYFRFLLKYAKAEGIFSKSLFGADRAYLLDNLRDNLPVDNEDTQKLILLLEARIKEHME